MPDDAQPPIPPPPGFRWEGPFPVPVFLPPIDDDEQRDRGRIERLLDGETCPICRRLLVAIDDLDGDRRERALNEYEAFKATMEDDHATEDDIKRIFESSPTLEHVLIDRLGVEELGVSIDG